MKKLLCRLAGLVALACAPVVLAQQATIIKVPIVNSGGSYVEATGVVQVDASGVPLGTAGNPLVTSGGGGGSVPTGTAGTPNAAVVTVQGISGGTAQNIAAATLPLPTGASTSALQTQMSAQFPASLGAKAGAASFSVVPNTDTAFPTYLNPSSAAAQAITPVSTAGAATSVLKASAGNVYGFNLVNNTTAIFAIVLDAATAPTSGTALTTANIKYCFPVAASAGFDKVFNPPVRVTSGATLLASTSCTTYTTPATLPVLLIGMAQ